jgi:cellulose biosynthesis protein BcsQ/class 3 adenylate cyclase
MSQIVTFYSFKGGVGRTMALANIALLLAQWGKRVLIVDWDLEAPGLEHYLSEFADPAAVAKRPGVLDLLFAAAENGANASVEAWNSAPLPISLNANTGLLHFIGSGTRDTDYFTKLRSLDVDSFYTRHGGGLILEQVRSSWKKNYDYVLLDSRTGITDFGGICTIHLPDVLVLLFTATQQSLTGVIDVAKRAGELRQKMPVDRLSLSCLPIPSRFDTSTEHQISQAWLSYFAEKLEPLYREWLPIEVDVRKFLETIKIPYIPYFSFGERLAVLEQGTTDPAGLGYSYESIAAVLANDLAYADQLLRNRDRYVRSAVERRAAYGDRAIGVDVATLFVEPDRSAVVGEIMAPAGQEAWLLRIEEQLQYVANEYHAERLSSGENSYVFRFSDLKVALQCALAMQYRLAVNPIRHGRDIVKARMGLHGSRSHESGYATDIVSLVRTAAALVANARAGQLIVSELVRQRFIDDKAWVRFKPVGPIDFRELEDTMEFVETYEAIGIKRVRLNERELELLFEQDPASRSEGGFQNFLVKLQEKTNRGSGDIDLTISDLERIARLAFDYRQGGWQNQLRRIFGRVLGETLGRDV